MTRGKSFSVSLMPTWTKTEGTAHGNVGKHPPHPHPPPHYYGRETYSTVKNAGGVGCTNKIIKIISFCLFMCVVFFCFNHLNTVIAAWKKRKRNGDGGRRGDSGRD